MGARMVLVARDRTRGEAALGRLRAISPGTAHSIYYADLSRIAEMKRIAAEITEAEPRVDVLINNAGALFGARQTTADHLEPTLATDHMAYFVLTLGLRATSCLRPRRRGWSARHRLRTWVHAEFC